MKVGTKSSLRPFLHRALQMYSNLVLLYSQLTLKYLAHRTYKNSCFGRLRNLFLKYCVQDTC